jgi:predicted HTH transcriptional regulator
MDKELKQLIQTGEGYHLEFKESLDKSLIEEVCAFANSSGGKVLLGVSDDGEIKGIKTDNNILSRIQDVVNRLEPKLNIKIFETRLSLFSRKKAGFVLMNWKIVKLILTEILIKRHL